VLEGCPDFGPVDPTFVDAVKAIGFYVVATVEKLEVEHRGREISEIISRTTRSLGPFNIVIPKSS
jgi:hypothetical protein